jgi:cell division protein FtsB
MIKLRREEASIEERAKEDLFGGVMNSSARSMSLKSLIKSKELDVLSSPRARERQRLLKLERPTDGINTICRASNSNFP